MDIKDILIGILVFIIILIIIIYLYKWFKKKAHERKRKRSKAALWPPYKYMSHVGVQCPSYWSYAGLNPSSNKIRCKNTFKIPIRQDLTKAGKALPPVCYDKKTN